MIIIDQHISLKMSIKLLNIVVSKDSEAFVYLNELEIVIKWHNKLYTIHDTVPEFKFHCNPYYFLQGLLMVLVV